MACGVYWHADRCQVTSLFPVSTTRCSRLHGNSVETWPFVKSLVITLTRVRRMGLTALCWQSKATTKSLLSKINAMCPKEKKVIS